MSNIFCIAGRTSLMHPDNSKVAKPFSLQIKCTPAKRAKDSDDDDDLDQGVSPVKKMKKTLPAKKRVIPLPCGQTATTKKGPATPSKQKVQVVIEARTSPTKPRPQKDTKDEDKEDNSSAEDSNCRQGSNEDVEMSLTSRSRNEAAMSKLVLDIDNPEVVDPNLKATYEDLPPVQKCEAIPSESAIHTVPYTGGFLNGHDINQKAFYNLVMLTEEEPFVINPAHYDSACVELATSRNSSNKVIFLPTLGKQSERAICMSIGFTYSCDIIHSKLFSKPGSSTLNYMKSILFGPMLTEWERTMGFFGTVFGVDKLSVGTFTAGGRYLGVNVCTFPSEPASDLAIWDTTQYFKKSKAPSKQFTFDLLPTLPRMTANLTFGDIVIVLYLVSSYNCENGMGLSLNLYGIVLVSRYQK
ncbi:hypothetical protein BV20DRAFT_980661 [Pilatotrama ljubarskyi]|nr:hypothetical protein BV20DRAFT_980661 [Pilatotrama ljubarskyi]